MAWLIGALAIVQALLVGQLAHQHLEYTQAVATTTHNLVELLESRLAGDFERIDGVLSFVAREISEEALRPMFSDADRAALKKRLTDLRISFSPITGLFIMDSEGTLRFSSESETSQVNISDRPHFQHLRDDPDLDLTFSDVIIARTTGERSIVQVRALRDGQGRFLGTVNAVISLEDVRRLLDAIDTGPAGVVFLRRSDTSMLIERQPRLNDEQLRQPLSRDDPVRLRIEAGERQGGLTYRASTDGVMRFGHFKVMDDYPFYVHVAIARSDYLAAWRHHAVLMAALAAALLLVFGLAIRYVRKSAAVEHTALLERQRLQSALLSVTEFACAAQGARSFEAVTAFAGRQFDADYVHIGMLEPDQTKVRVVAGHLKGTAIHPGHVYALDGSPWGAILDRRFGCSFNGGFQQQFPQDHDLEAFQAEACIGEPILDRDGRVLGLIALVSSKPMGNVEAIGAGLRILAARVGTDLARWQDEQALRNSEEKHRLLFETMSQGAIYQSADGTVTSANPAAQRILGLSLEQILGTSTDPLWKMILEDGTPVPGEEDPAMVALRTGQPVGPVVRGVSHSGRDDHIWLSITATPQFRPGETVAFQAYSIFSDVTEQKTHEQQLAYIAYHDQMTGLRNRVACIRELQRTMAQCDAQHTRLALLCIDLDGFGDVNTGINVEAGDQVIRELGRRLAGYVRDHRNLARIGGDEFAIILPAFDGNEHDMPVVEQILQLISEPIEVSGMNLEITASIGVSLYPQNEPQEAEQLLRQADQAMYLAKLAGKNRSHVFDVVQDHAVRSRHESVERICQALADREFVLHYQPKVNMRSGDVVGVEALIRWNHPVRGLLSPNAFLPLIEDHPVAIAIGDWVLDTALAQISAWREAGLCLPVSVNVGARQLQQSNFVQGLRDHLAKHPDVPANQLELEVLETSALEDIDHVSSVIAACAAMGVDFALDDFGTGYSSLTYLKRLPAQTLKIDQSFVRDILDDPENLSILEGVLSLASAFHRQSIAEGVETAAHGEMLLDFGCDLAQGFGIARPMPAENIPAWLENWQPESSWRNRPLRSRADCSLLFMTVEHRAWVTAVENHIKDFGPAPALDPDTCRFGIWLDGGGRERLCDNPSFREVEQIHLEAHEKARALLALKAQGKNDQAVQGLADLNTLRDRFLEKITSLFMQEEFQKTPGPGRH